MGWARRVLARPDRRGGPRHRRGHLRRQGDAPATGAAVNAYVCTIGVDSLDETLTAITGNGGEIVVAKHEIPGIGTLAYFKDPDGNIFGALQPV